MLDNSDIFVFQPNQACSVYINSVAKDGDKIGVVVFTTQAIVNKGITVVNSNTRGQLVASLPTSAGGGNSIAAGKYITYIDMKSKSI